jgi:hypothetical protein
MGKVENWNVALIIPNDFLHEEVGCVFKHETVVDGHGSNVRG